MSVEIKVGQKYRVVNVGMFAGVDGLEKGNVLVVTEVVPPRSNHEVYRVALDEADSAVHTIIDKYDVVNGYIELISDVVEDTEEESDTNTQGSSEDVSEASAESSSDMFEVANTVLSITRHPEMDYGELLWKMIEGSPEYDGHKNIGIDEMSFDMLKSLVKILSDSCESIHNIISIRMYLESSGNVSVNVNQDCFWKEGEHPSGHRSRLLFYVNKVTGV